MIGEIDEVMALIGDALGMSASYGDSLTGATKKLVGSRRTATRSGPSSKRW